MFEIKCYYGFSQDLPSIEIRQKVFVDEQKFTEEFDWVDKRSYHFVVFDKKKHIATARMFLKSNFERTFIIGRVAVLKEYRGQNIGRIIMGEIEKTAKSLGAECIELSSQERAADFYQKLGYQKSGEIYYDEYCPHIKMIKTL